VRPNFNANGMQADYTAAFCSSASKVSGSLISAGCHIQGTVINSVLSPGVVVKPGAVVRDSILFHNCRIEEKAEVDLAILDKQVVVNKGAKVGNDGNKDTVNRLYPKHLHDGITLVGKEVVLPAGMRVGRNCIISPWTQEESLRNPRLEDGESA
jgi:glucose-1-phosphate adenylyltransferase